uniref:LITAF domain-containing protein n=2 Tax=Tetranychus urticae TaxID=32264 RepID=T1K2W8_TETUR
MSLTTSSLAMDNNKDLPGYGATFSYERPPPYDASFGTTDYDAGPSTFVYNQLPESSFDKTPIPDQTQPYQSNKQFTANPNDVPINNVPIHISNEFGPYSQNAVCPHCNQYVVTKTKHVPGLVTWLTCLVFSYFCCCCLPFCMDSCRNVDHKCPNCKQKIGHYQRYCK